MDRSAAADSEPEQADTTLDSYSMRFPPLNSQLLRDRLRHPSRPVRIVLDTDTYNEIDDQFAVVYALLSPEAMTVEALHAAPFHNNRSSSPADGMEKSFEEIHRLLARLPSVDTPGDGFVMRGATKWMKEGEPPVESQATADLIERALASPRMIPSMLSPSAPSPCLPPLCC